jgi:putative transcriptional regulator
MMLSCGQRRGTALTLQKILWLTNIVRKIIAIMLKSPSSEQLKSTRKALGYTQKEAAELVHVSLRAWQLWEAGDRKMPPGIWELCVIKAGLHPLYRAVKA